MTMSRGKKLAGARSRTSWRLMRGMLKVGIAVGATALAAHWVLKGSVGPAATGAASMAVAPIGQPLPIAPDEGAVREVALAADSDAEAEADCGAIAVPEQVPAADREVAGYDPGTAGFSVQVKDEVIPYEVFAIYVMPGEEIELEAVLGARDSVFDACADSGEMTPIEADRWGWRAPDEPGLYGLRVTDTTRGDEVVLNAFVLRPYDGETALDGYRIGDYEKVPLRGLAAYDVPRGLIELTEDLTDTPVSPHFTVGQFVSRQQSGFPKFLVLSERLLLKLERLLEELNDEGIEASTLTIMSGYRTPFYNASIGNRTIYSRHCYGDAADVFIDDDGDGRLDDLTGDGRVDRADAEAMARVVDDLVGETWYEPFLGGLGIYGTAPHRGPFIHVDTRGFRARW